MQHKASIKIIIKNHPGKEYEDINALQHQTIPDHIQEKNLLIYTRNSGTNNKIIPANTDAIVAFLIDFEEVSMVFPYYQYIK